MFEAMPNLHGRGARRGRVLGPVRSYVACVAVALLSGPLHGADLYVGERGCSDATEREMNSQAAPWCTIGRAAWGSDDRRRPDPSQAARAGDTVHIAEGVYVSVLDTGQSRWDVLYNPVNEGANGSPLKFLATGEVHLRAPRWGGPIAGATQRDYVHWVGPFVIDEAHIRTVPDTGPVVFNDTTGSGIDGATIDGDGGKWADNHAGVRFEPCRSCFVRNTTIHDFYSLQGRSSRNGAGVMLYDSDDTLIEHNHIYNVGAGIYVKGTAQASPQDRTVVRFNLIHDVQSFALIVQHTAEGRYYQNVIRDSHTGVLFSGSEDITDHPIRDIVANNTLDNLSGTAVYYSGVWDDVKFQNNIVTRTPLVHASDSNAVPDSILIDYNLYDGFRNLASFTSGRESLRSWQSNHDSATLEADPIYVDGAGGDYRLCSGAGQPASGCRRASPALTTGRDILDLDGDGSTVDEVAVGAYVTGAELIGPGAP